MEVRVSINPLEVPVAHQKKSGSSGRQSSKPKDGVREATVIAPEVWRLVRQAVTIAERFESGSNVAHETLEQMFLSLIQRYGVEVCGDVLCSPWARSDKERLRAFSCTAFGALITLRRFREAKPLISRMKLLPLQRMGMYTLMGVRASAEDRPEILTEMRSYVETIGDWNSYFDARYRIYVVSGQEDDRSFLNRNMFKRFYSAPRLTAYEVTLMLEMNLLEGDIEGTCQALAALERLPPGPPRDLGELRFRQMLIGWGRSELLVLYAALEGSRYAAVVQRIALDTRDPSEYADLDDETPSSPSP